MTSRLVAYATDLLAVDGNEATLQVLGDLDLAAEASLAQVPDRLPHGVRELHVDLAGVDFLDLRGLDSLRALQDALTARSITMCIHRPPSMMILLLDVLRLEGLFRLIAASPMPALDRSGSREASCGGPGRHAAKPSGDSGPEGSVRWVSATPCCA